MSSKEYVLITGGSTGIGFELAKLFAKDNYNLILVARNENSLQQAKSELQKISDIKIVIKPLDLVKRESCDELFNFLKINDLNVDILINNAGVGSFGEFNDLDWSSEERLLDLNIKALTSITKRLLQPMVQRRRGKILNVASTAAFCAGPLMATYYASKAYVLNFSEALHEEVKDKGVLVSCLCPGAVDTTFQRKAGIIRDGKSNLMAQDEVARIAYREFNKGKAIIIPGSKNKLIIVINKLLPRSISRRTIYRLNGGKN